MAISRNIGRVLTRASSVAATLRHRQPANRASLLEVGLRPCFSTVSDHAVPLYESEEIGQPGGSSISATTSDASVASSSGLENFAIEPALRKSLERAGITSLFPVQAQAFDPVVQGRDMVGKSPTGSGKTLAFVIPIVQKLIVAAAEGGLDGRVQTLVISPTRELARQIEKEFRRVAPQLRTACIYGGVEYRGQLRSLSDGCDVVVGTPGRLIDLMDRGGLRLNAVNTLVIDEADEMLKMGFQEPIERILADVPETRQMLMWSATVPTWVRRLMQRHLKDPVSVDLVGEGARIPAQVRNIAFASLPEHRQLVVQRAVSGYANNGRVLVFTNTKSLANELAMSSAFPKGKAAPLHGDMSQAARENTLRRFHQGRIQCIVATDVAARGLDIPDVELVVHYEVPEKAEAFVHRSGRTGRAGKSGINVVLYTPGQERDLFSILDEVEVTPEMPELPIASDTATQAAVQGRKAVSRTLQNTVAIPHEFTAAAAKLVESAAAHGRALAGRGHEHENENENENENGPVHAEASQISEEREQEQWPRQQIENLVAAALMEASGFSATCFSRLTGRKDSRTLLMRSKERARTSQDALRQLEEFVDADRVHRVALCDGGILFDTSPGHGQFLLDTYAMPPSPPAIAADVDDSTADGDIAIAMADDDDDDDDDIAEVNAVGMSPIFSVPDTLPKFRTDGGRGRHGGGRGRGRGRGSSRSRFGSGGGRGRGGRDGREGNGGGRHRSGRPERGGYGGGGGGGGYGGGQDRDRDRDQRNSYESDYSRSSSSSRGGQDNRRSRSRGGGGGRGFGRGRASGADRW